MYKVWFMIMLGKTAYVGSFEREYAMKANACKMAKQMEAKTGIYMVASIENPFKD